MKKLVALPIAILFICCGCAKSNVVTPILDNISFVASIHYDKQEFICDASITEGALNLVVSEPKQIKGFTININKNGMTTDFMGISNDSAFGLLSRGNLAQILFNVLNDAATKQTIFDSENCKIIGRVDEYKYKFYFSPSGLPLSLKIEDIDVEIKFNNVALK